MKNINLKINTNINIVSITVIIFMGILVYSNSFDCSFHFDDVEDIVEEFASVLDRSPHPGPSILPEIRLSEEENRIYEVLSETPVHIDAIAKQAEFPPARALSLLLSMELNGTVKQLSGKMFVRA